MLIVVQEDAVAWQVKSATNFVTEPDNNSPFFDSRSSTLAKLLSHDKSLNDILNFSNFSSHCQGETVLFNNK